MNPLKQIALGVAGLRSRYVMLFAVIIIVVMGGASGLILVDNTPRAFAARMKTSLSHRVIHVKAPIDADGKRLDASAVQRFQAINGVAEAEGTYSLSGDLVISGAANAVPVTLLPYRSVFPPPLSAGRVPEGGLQTGQALIPAHLEGQDLSGFLGKEMTLVRNESRRPGETVPVKEKMKVVGLIEPYWQVEGRNPVYVAGQAAAEWLRDLNAADSTGAPIEGYSSVGVLVDEGQDVTKILDEIQRAGWQASTGAQTSTEVPEALDSFAALSKMLRWLGGILGAFVVFFVVRGLALTRVREVGLLKSLGYRSGRIFAVMVGECVAVALAAALVGLAGSSVVTAWVASRAGSQALPPGATLLLALPHPVLAVEIVLFTVAVVIASAALPIVKASRREASQALRIVT
ncbi:hypothetical protein TH66_17830 [Carbonactinospora thermoautotrophica]|uniref:ABC3 transporter permease C-terminal domain-containing protein n=1 Tax=Carbonactinospora thermoautotrophica TaxID=1469144 RepID=A0A132NBL6_9ACTN|nr:ABC transporter permease [Carbonactinospora thermoautotrophica]KWW97491.1 hypothetical protein TH66_17830 [Carbonactinospora thermoautotrophica]KWW98780.1 hypothetical protein LI90_409 [Carbonactinospora thermoautotrophica]KWX06952.1 hypothetical protein TR74_20365 [Carbonactinospora thermoautotrophica]